MLCCLVILLLLVALLMILLPVLLTLHPVFATPTQFVQTPRLEFPENILAIPEWYLQSSKCLSDDQNLTFWSLPTTDVSSWYRTGARSTVFAALLANNVYNEMDLFYSDNLVAVDSSAFQIPWLYRRDLDLPSLRPGEHAFIITHGITSKADILVNGVQIVSSEVQQGSHVGNTYEITSLIVPGANTLLIQAYPTEYLRDLVQGFADWNPPPPDHGMGVWRDVEVKLTRSLSLSPPRVITNFTSIDPTQQPLTVDLTVKTNITNHENAEIDAFIQGTITSPDIAQPQTIEICQLTRLLPYQNAPVDLEVSIPNPQIWWPATWGAQPLYKLDLNVTLLSSWVSDIAPPMRFGIRSVASSLNEYNARQFTVNGYPFQVRGAGYAPDIFFQYDPQRLRTIFQHVLDLGLNTVRLEGKQEHPELYDLADEMGIMVLAGWECCDKWEGWEYNDDADGVKWTDPDYTVAFNAMFHESTMMQPHPSLLGFLIGSDYWPNERATDAYLSALDQTDWTNPVIAAASKRGHPPQLPPSGLDMDGPYDWVPPNYWTAIDTSSNSSDPKASGFGSELGGGVGTPGLQNLRRFLSTPDLDQLWRNLSSEYHPHLSPRGTVFANRQIYNDALVARYGAPVSLEDYVTKAQMMDYEATRAQFEAFAMRMDAPTHPATGVVYWMLNAAWPSLHWQLFDSYLDPVPGAYFGAKTGLRRRHVVYQYTTREVYVVNHLLKPLTGCRVDMELVDLNGTALANGRQSIEVEKPVPALGSVQLPGLSVPILPDGVEVAFLRLVLSNKEGGKVHSRNLYWVTNQLDMLDWDKTTWYSTPVSNYTDFTALSRMSPGVVGGTVIPIGATTIEVTVENRGLIPAVFLQLAMIDPATGEEVRPVVWSDNMVTLLGGEKLVFTLEIDKEREQWRVVARGVNVGETVIGYRGYNL